MKTFLRGLIASILVVSLAGCGNKENNENKENNKKKV